MQVARSMKITNDPGDIGPVIASQGRAGLVVGGDDNKVDEAFSSATKISSFDQKTLVDRLIWSATKIRC